MRDITEADLLAAERLRAIWNEKRKQRKFTQESAGAEMGMTQGAVSQYLLGKTALGTEAIFKFAKYLRVPPQEIRDDIMLQLNTPTIVSSRVIDGHLVKEYAPDESMRPRAIPLLSWVQAGDWTEAMSGDYDKHHVVGHFGENIFALRVKGDSMLPVFPENCIIVVDPNKQPETGSYIIAQINNATEATFKQLIREGNTIYLRPLNDRYPVIRVDEPMTICGVVVEMSMRF